MALKRPVAGDPVTVEDFGQPIYDAVTGLMLPVWQTVTLQAGWTAFQGLTPAASRGGDLVVTKGAVTTAAAQPQNAAIIAYPSSMTFTVNRNVIVSSSAGAIPCWIDAAANVLRVSNPFSAGGWIGLDAIFAYVR